MKLLAVDCSTEACSVAVLSGDAVYEHHNLAPKRHTQELLPFIVKVLTQAELSIGQLDVIAFGAGPGSFTGLRICLGAVQGLAYGADIPVIPISSLAVLAQTAVLQKPVADGAMILSAFDARMDEVYWGLYRNAAGLVNIQGQEHLSSPEQLVLNEKFLPEDMSTDEPIIAVGSGWRYQQRIPSFGQASIDEKLLPHASAMLSLAENAYRQGLAIAADKAQPSYLRDEVAWQKQK